MPSPLMKLSQFDNIDRILIKKITSAAITVSTKFSIMVIHLPVNVMISALPDEPRYKCYDNFFI